MDVLLGARRGTELKNLYLESSHGAFSNVCLDESMNTMCMHMCMCMYPQGPEENAKTFGTRDSGDFGSPDICQLGTKPGFSNC